MNWILAFILILISIYIFDRQLKKRKRVKTKKKIIQDWGSANQDKHLNFSLIDQFFRNHEISAKAYQTITDHTWQDLDLDEIFKFLDRTTSKIGQQFLYFKLRTISGIPELNRFRALTETFNSNPELRIKTQLELSRLSTDKAYYLEEVFRSKDMGKSNKIWLFRMLSLGSVTSIILSFLIQRGFSY